MVKIITKIITKVIELIYQLNRIVVCLLTTAVFIGLFGMVDYCCILFLIISIQFIKINGIPTYQMSKRETIKSLKQNFLLYDRENTIKESTDPGNLKNVLCLFSCQGLNKDSFQVYFLFELPKKCFHL